MENYKIERHDDDQVLTCRYTGFIDDEAAVRLARDWRAAVLTVRAEQPILRVLFDNRSGHVMSPKGAAMMAESTRDLARNSDRTAVLAANSIAKLQAKRMMTNPGQVFISERAARLWLLAA